MEENILFSNADVKVTSQHLNVHGKIYPIADIHFVESRFVEPKRILALILLFTGLILLLDEGSLFALGGFCVLLGIVFWVSGGTKYSVMIHTQVGEHKVITSDDQLMIEKVIHALDKAMLNGEQPRALNSQSSLETSYRESAKDISFGAS